MGDNKFYWLKLKRDFFKRTDIKIVEKMQNGKDYILFYLKLLLESVECEGRLRLSDTIPYNEEMLSTITDTNVDIVRSAMNIFTKLNMIEVLDDQTVYMTEIKNMIGSETKWAEKKRQQRTLPTLKNGSKRCNSEFMVLPNGNKRYVDEKRYGGNGMFVLDRAKGKCELCGSEENVVIHHNNGYSNEPNDLICLCEKCHGKVHSNEWGGQIPPNVLSLSDKSKSIELEKELDIEIDKDISPKVDISLEKEINKEREVVDKPKRKKSVPPTLEEVKAYCLEKNLSVNAERFYEYYQAGDWKDAKGNTVKSWKQKLLTWEGRNNDNTPRSISNIRSKSNNKNCFGEMMEREGVNPQEVIYGTGGDFNFT